MFSRTSRGAARRLLAEWGVRQPFSVRHQWLLLVVLFALALVAGLAATVQLYSATAPGNPGLFGTVAVAFTLVGAVSAYQQWRTARYEVTFDKYYDRLDVVNSRLSEWEEARELMSDPDGSGSLNDPGTWRRKLYVFHELDLLEYAVEKYRMGLMHPELAMRGVQTFRQRCRWANFRQAVEKTLEGRYDYSAEMVGLVHHLVRLHSVSPGAQSEYEQPRSPAERRATEAVDHEEEL
jgi:hypothetical protein